jgi:hypothetical protein
MPQLLRAAVTILLATTTAVFHAQDATLLGDLRLGLFFCRMAAVSLTAAQSSAQPSRLC